MIKNYNNNNDKKNPVLVCQTFDIFIIKLVSSSPSNETPFKGHGGFSMLETFGPLKCRSCLVECPYVEVIPTPVTHWKLVE